MFLSELLVEIVLIEPNFLWFDLSSMISLNSSFLFFRETNIEDSLGSLNLYRLVSFSFVIEMWLMLEGKMNPLSFFVNMADLITKVFPIGVFITSSKIDFDPITSG